MSSLPWKAARLTDLNSSSSFAESTSKEPRDEGSYGSDEEPAVGRQCHVDTEEMINPEGQNGRVFAGSPAFCKVIDLYLSKPQDGSKVFFFFLFLWQLVGRLVSVPAAEVQGSIPVQYFSGVYVHACA